jgi:hypothetical protein
MKIGLPVTMLLLCCLFSQAQTPNWSEHIAPIVYTNCSNCHREGGIAPFALMSYEEASNASFYLANSVSERRMPPWPPSPTYSSFAHERVLTSQEIELINQWHAAGAPEGNPDLAPPPPVFNSASQLSSIDLTKKITTYTVQSPQDEYRCFTIPSGLTQKKFAEAIEVIPGNSSIVHHVLVFYDTTGQCAQNDANDPLPGYSCFGGSGCGDSRLIGLWVPGSTPQLYPQGMGIELNANGHFVLQVHYAPGSQGQTDSSKINIRFTPNNFVRPIFISSPLDHISSLTNGPLYIPANTTKTFYSQYTVPINVSVLAIGPHMHLIGSSIKSYAFAPDAPSDTVRLIDIPKWNFHWQGLYFFPKVKKMSSGTVLRGEAYYDNTGNNLFNPNNPPEPVTLGEGTGDEMMLIYFAYTYYLNGDENIIQDSSAVFTTVSRKQMIGDVQLVPNPAQHDVRLLVQCYQPGDVIITLNDVTGRIIKHVADAYTVGEMMNTFTIPTADIPNGLYIVQVRSGNEQRQMKLMIQH